VTDHNRVRRSSTVRVGGGKIGPSCLRPGRVVKFLRGCVTAKKKKTDFGTHPALHRSLKVPRQRTGLRRKFNLEIGTTMQRIHASPAAHFHVHQKEVRALKEISKIVT